MSGIVRSITHWTAGGPMANATDRKHYHRITQQDGTIVEGKEAIDDNLVTSDGDYAAHTLRLNTGSAGFALAGMKGAVESPFDPGPFPILEDQFEAHCRMLAKFHDERGIPVTRTTCLTHAEVEPTLGVKQRNKWDLTRLVFRPDIRGAIPVGDYMRDRVRSYMLTAPETNDRPILRKGQRGMFVKEAQVLLADASYPVGKPDGIFGPNTQHAVLSFQSDHGLKTTGMVDADTWRNLMEPNARPLRAVTESDLRSGGSRTVKAADQAQTGVKWGAGGIGGLTILDTMRDASAQARDLSLSFDSLLAVIGDNWPVLIVVAMCVAAYLKGPDLMQSIRDARTEDAQSGANMKR